MFQQGALKQIWELMSTSRLERLLPVAQLVSTIAVPLIIAAGGWWVQATLARNAIAEQELQIALAVQSSPRHSGDERLREWAARTISARFQKNTGIGVRPSDLSANAVNSSEMTASAVAVPIYLNVPSVDPAVAEPAPPPLTFSKCLREIFRYGATRRPVSPECAKLVTPANESSKSGRAKPNFYGLAADFAVRADQVSAQLRVYQRLYNIVSQEQESM